MAKFSIRKSGESKPYRDDLCGMAYHDALKRRTALMDAGCPDDLVLYNETDKREITLGSPPRKVTRGVRRMRASEAEWEALCRGAELATAEARESDPDASEIPTTTWLRTVGLEAARKLERRHQRKSAS